MDYEFSGWDWTDILDAIGKLPEENLGESLSQFDRRCADLILEMCDNAMKSYWQDTNEYKDFIEACRMHCIALSKISVEAKGLWNGLSEVTNDYSFMSYFKTLFKHMWN